MTSWEDPTIFPLDANHKRLAELNEGRKAKPYVDTVGKVTIGVGHNLTDRGLSERAIDFILYEDLREAREQLLRRYPWMLRLDPVRFAVMLDLCFNMGIGTFSTFRNTLRAVEADDYVTAGEHLVSSKWFRQVGRRGPRMVKMLVTGEWPWQSSPDAAAPTPTSKTSGSNS